MSLVFDFHRKHVKEALARGEHISKGVLEAHGLELREEPSQRLGRSRAPR